MKCSSPIGVLTRRLAMYQSHAQKRKEQAQTNKFNHRTKVCTVQFLLRVHLHHIPIVYLIIFSRMSGDPACLSNPCHDFLALHQRRLRLRGGNSRHPAVGRSASSPSLDHAPGLQDRAVRESAGFAHNVALRHRLY